MKILFTGDTFLGGDLLDLKKHNGIFHSKIKNATYVITTLEQAVSDNSLDVNKCTLYSPSVALNHLLNNNINVVNLANNHIQDKGEEGIFDTLNSLIRNSIHYLGAGKNIYNAAAPFYINDDYCLLSYCEHSKKHLNKVQVANENLPGVNPLSFDKVCSDLKKIPVTKKVFVLIHWGYENIRLPPYENIILAKKILELDRIEAIIGSHPHKIQGVVHHNNKRAYMSLGNFLFPNFVMQPRTKICYSYADSSILNITKEYHPVSNLTYKKWKKSNRTSLLLSFDLTNKTFEEDFAIQDDNEPIIHELSKKGKQKMNKKLKRYSSSLKYPKIPYIIVFSAYKMIHIVIRYVSVLSFYLFKEKSLKALK